MRGVPIYYFFFFSSRRRHTRFDCDWSSDVCSSDLAGGGALLERHLREAAQLAAVQALGAAFAQDVDGAHADAQMLVHALAEEVDRKSTRLNSSHSQISYAVFCLKKKKKKN